MLWYDGPIRNAVNKVKSSGVMLLVFVHGEDDLSKTYDSILNERIKLTPGDYVAIKIPEDSVALKQFKQIYVTVPIPSVFIIDNNGMPINVIHSDQAYDILSLIKTTVEKRKSDKQKIRKTIRNNKTESNDQIDFESDKNSIKESAMIPKEHIKNIGCKLYNITEEEIKQRLKEIRAFPRFLAFDSSSSSETSIPSEPYPPPCRKFESARIQFRLPNNDMPSWEFPDKSTLKDVRAYLMEKTKLSPNFKLLRAFPRKSFTPKEETKTLMELCLIPNATLIVVPVNDATVQARMKTLIVQQSFVMNIIKAILQPVFIVLKFLKKHVLKMPEESETRPQRLESDTAVEKIYNKKTSTSNIHGFNFEDDDDTDEDHPDNGNSTQQKFQKK